MSFVTESSFVAHLPTIPGGVTPSTAFITVAALLAGYLVANGIYSLTLHPLARFPGPTWGAVTRVPFWVACINGTQVTWMNELHKRYGPVVRYGPNDLSYADEGGEAWKAIHGHEKGGREFGKAKEWFVAPANGKQSSLSCKTLPANNTKASTVSTAPPPTKTTGATAASSPRPSQSAH